MPKKNGIMKTYSFDERTIKQIAYLSNVLFLKPTSLIEFLINKEYIARKKGEEKENVNENNGCEN